MLSHARLDVLRALIAEATNATKASKPIQTDIQLLALLRKRIAAATDAAEQFQSAGRQDLVEKEMGQIRIISEYASVVKTVGDGEVADIVRQVLEKRRSEGQQVSQGALLKDLFAGPLADQPVERGAVAAQVKKLLDA